jgi:hypothetical protein
MPVGKYRRSHTVVPGRWIVTVLVCLLVHLNLYSQVTIPVVVHIVSGNPDAITDGQIISAIEDLNNAFAHTGVYAVGNGANTGIRFCLARTDPDGAITNGITRTKSELADFDSEIENTRAKN